MSRAGSFVVVLAVVVLAGTADARERKKRRDRPEAQPHSLSDSRGERGDAAAAAAAQMAVQANGGGRVLAVDRRDGGYRVKVLKDGEVRTHFISPE